MAFTILADKYHLPSDKFIQTLISERFPTLDVRKGSALYKLVVKPAALLVEPFRRQLNIFRRNQTVLAFEDMLEYELDQLVANYFVERREPGVASGIIRVFVPDARDLTVPTSARFSTNGGLQFLPIATTFISAADLLVNESGGFFFVDVPVIAEAAGEDYVVDANTIVNFEGVPAAFIDNPQPTFGGRDLETNTQLVARTRFAIATRTLTAVNAIRSTLFDAFDTLKSVDVVGFGDPEMERDVIQAVTSFQELFGVRFAQKLNLTVDASFNITTNPSGQETGVILDVNNTYGTTPFGGDPYFFHTIEVDSDTVESYVRSVQRGDIVVLESSNPADASDNGRYVVKNVVFGTWDIAQPKTHLLILDRPFTNTTFTIPPNGTADATAHEYTIESAARVDEFHVGGAADIYINSSNIQEEDIIVTQLVAKPSVIPTELFDVPISSEPVDVPTSPGTPWFENSEVFLLPFLDIVAIEVLDSTTETVLQTLERGVDYIFITKNPDTRFTEQEESFIRFLNATLEGERVRITYKTNPDVSSVQAFVDDPLRRDITANLLVRSVQPVQVDFSFSYSGGPSVDEVIALLTTYVDSRPQGGAVLASEVVAFLSVFGVTKVALPLTMTSVRFADDGTVERQTSTDQLSIDIRQVFQMAAAQDITKTG